MSRVIKRNEGVELAKNYYFVQLPLSEALKSLILESEIQGRDEIISLLYSRLDILSLRPISYILRGFAQL